MDYLEHIKSKHRPLFWGRSKEIEALDEVFASSETGRLHIAIIQGIPGMGKTQLAINYVLRHVKKRPACKPIFINAQTPDTLEESMKEFRRIFHKGAVCDEEALLRWRREDIPKGRKFQDVLQKSPNEWFLVVEDVDLETIDGVERLLPVTMSGSGVGNIILTTRYPRIYDIIRMDHEANPRGIQLTDLLVKDAANIAAKLLHLHGNAKKKDSPRTQKAERYKWRPVLEKLSCSPLLIEQFVTFVRANPSFQPSTQVSNAVIEAICLYTPTAHPGAKPTVSFFGACAPRFRHFDRWRQVGTDLLRIMCFLNPKKIDLVLLHNCFIVKHSQAEVSDTPEAQFLVKTGRRLDHLYALMRDEISLKDVLINFAKLGILDLADGAMNLCSFTHPMFQVVARAALMPSRQERLDWLGLTLSVVEGGITPLVNATFEQRQTKLLELTPHLETLRIHCRENGVHTPFIQAAQIVRGTIYQVSDAKYRQAILWKERALEVLQSNPSIGADQRYIYKTVLDLGILYYKTALSNTNKTTLLEIAQRRIGQAYNWFAAEVSLSSESREALVALTIVLIEQQNTAQLRQALGLLTKAINTLQNSAPTLAFQLEILQLQDVTVRAVTCIARCDGEWYRLGDARRMSLDILEQKTNLLGKNAEQVMISKETLANVLWACLEGSKRGGTDEEVVLNLADEAVKLLSAVYRWYRREESQQHPETERLLLKRAVWRRELKAARKEARRTKKNLKVDDRSSRMLVRKDPEMAERDCQEMEVD